jgi:hypothetical protein
MVFAHDVPPSVAFVKTHGQAELKLSFSPLRSVPQHRLINGAKATSAPTVTFTSWKSKATGFVDQAKNVFHVAI